jgi:hypothetical protein
MVQRAITQTRWRLPSCFREYFWDGAVFHLQLRQFRKSWRHVNKHSTFFKRVPIIR